MKFLLFNLVVTGSLIYLLAGADVIQIPEILPAQDQPGPVEQAASEQNGQPAVAVRRTRDQFQSALRKAIETARSGGQEGSLDLKAIEAYMQTEKGPDEESPPLASESAVLEQSAEPPDRATPVEELPLAAEPEPNDPPWEALADEAPGDLDEDANNPEPSLKAPPPPVDARVPVQVVETSDQAVIKRRAEVLGDGFKIAGSDARPPTPAAPRAPRPEIKPSREIAAMTPQQRSRELDRLALDMELMFAERVGR